MKNFDDIFGSNLVPGKDISSYLTMKTKVRAEYYILTASRDDLVKTISKAYEYSIPFTIIGGGSNIAVLKDEIKGLVIHNKYMKLEVASETHDYCDILISSGYPMSRVVLETQKLGLSGFEYQMGLPGSLGGAIYMNSKWTTPTSYCGDHLLTANLITKNGKIQAVNRDYFHFDYDYSILQKTKEILIDAVFRLTRENESVLVERSKKVLEHRVRSQPSAAKTAGCIFKNISESDKNGHNLPTTSSGYLIDQAGLKGYRLGSYEVSPVHANFIVNTGEGNARDLQEIINHIKRTVFDRFGIKLDEEVTVIN